MIKRHADTLKNRLEEAFLRGSAFVAWDELYRWYGARRIASGTWGDIQERWNEVCEDHECELLITNGAGGIYFSPETSTSKLSDIVDVGWDRAPSILGQKKRGDF